MKSLLLGVLVLPLYGVLGGVVGGALGGVDAVKGAVDGGSLLPGSRNSGAVSPLGSGIRKRQSDRKLPGWRGYPGKHDYPGNPRERPHYDDEDDGKTQYPAHEKGCAGNDCEPPRRPHPSPKPKPPKPHPPKPWNPCKFCGLVQEDPEEFEHRGHHCKKICKWVPDHKWPWQNGKDEHSDVSSLEDEPDEEDEIIRLVEGADIAWLNPDNTVVARQENEGRLKGFNYPGSSRGGPDEVDGEGRQYDGDDDDDKPNFGWKGGRHGEESDDEEHHDKPGYHFKKCPKFCKKKCWKKCWKPKSNHDDKPSAAAASEPAVAVASAPPATTSVEAAASSEPPAAIAAAPSEPESEPESEPAAPLTPALTAEEIIGVTEALPGCPATCNPQSGLNRCDVTTSCTATGGRPTMCACRAGFRLDGTNPNDFVRQIKVNGQPFVYAAPGFACNTPCSDSTCSEVLVRDFCIR